MKRIVCLFFALSFVLGAYSQEDTPIPSINSPYSMYGYGKMTDLSFARGRAMGGVGYGFREGTEINISNPASYSAVDSMTFIFDAGMSFQNTNLNDGVNKANAKMLRSITWQCNSGFARDWDLQPATCPIPM